MERPAPIVMLSDHVKEALQLEEKYPGRMGCLFGPVCLKRSHGLPYALDNGRYTAWANKKKWQEAAFLRFLSRAARYPTPPRWVIVPDVVADPVLTLRWWEEWADRLKAEFGWPLAVAVQDGMVPRDVHALWPEPDVVFVGGSTVWKWRTLPTWCRSFPRVHVGRANGEDRLWTAHRAGCESSDGTGWYRDPSRKKRFEGLHRYLDRSSKGLGPGRRGFFY